MNEFAFVATSSVTIFMVVEFLLLVLVMSPLIIVIQRLMRLLLTCLGIVVTRPWKRTLLRPPIFEERTVVYKKTDGTNK
jgi:Mg2+/Co2+ transporter CorB